MRAKISGEQIKSASIQETHLSLSDTTDGNATTARHGLLPKLSGNASEFLNGLGQWAAAGGASQTLPSDTYFVSPAFTTNSGQFWSDLKLLESEINSSQSTVAPLIVVYPGTYQWTGDLNFTKAVAILADSAVLGGNIVLTQGATIYADTITNLKLDNAYGEVLVEAKRIVQLGTIGITEEPVVVIADDIGSCDLRAQNVSCDITSGRIGGGLVVNGSGTSLRGAYISCNVFGGGNFTVHDSKIQSSSVVINAEAKARFHNCYFNVNQIEVINAHCALYDCFVRVVPGDISLNYGTLLLANTNVVTSDQSITGNGALYVRGGSTSNQQIANTVAVRTATTLTIDYAYEGETGFY